MILEGKPNLLLLLEIGRFQTQLKTVDGNYRVNEWYNQNTK